MNAFLRSYKQAVRNFMRAHYSDERLAMLLAHAQSGRLAYSSCCCFIGVATADHALRGAFPYTATYDPTSHCITARELDGAREAEHAYWKLWGGHYLDADEVRRRRLIPMIRAEMRRRERVRAEQHSAAEAVLA